MSNVCSDINKSCGKSLLEWNSKYYRILNLTPKTSLLFHQRHLMIYLKYPNIQEYKFKVISSAQFFRFRFKLIYHCVPGTEMHSL